MPTYEYRCPKGHIFEVTQSINDDPLTKCEVCGRPVERVLYSPAVHFKGSGFYNTDYGTKKRQREKSSGGGESDSSESGGSSSSSGGSGSSSGGDSKPSSEPRIRSDSKPSSDKPKPAPKSE
ncbi:MAG: FmdB family zinc ribbon protein [Solirubrobacteraceae bacterium]